MSTIAPINPQTADANTTKTLEAVRAKLGLVPNMVLTMAHSPTALGGYLQFSGALAGGKLSGRRREAIAIAVAQSNSCGYCLSAHTAIGQGLGLSSSDIADARRGRAADAADAALVTLAQRIVATQGHPSASDIAAFRVAAGEPLSITQSDVGINGWAIESRLYAEDPYRNFLPSIGRLTRYRPPEEVAADAIAVRNDTGVFEGGEISMYYDPMIAKLCTWAPDRASAIEAMRNALDGFEVEGIGHNLPFLSAVMDHPRFISGEITTAFIAEEYPEGFGGAALPLDTMKRLAALAVRLHVMTEERATQISGAMANHRRALGRDWVVRLDNTEFKVSVDQNPGVLFEDGTSFQVASDWLPGQILARGEIDGEALIAKVQSMPGYMRMRHRGADLKVRVYSPRHAELAALMHEKLPPDTSKMLLCPMPGLVVSINVKEGDEVFDGQSLCTVEAMKMENVLRAERKAVVSKIIAKAGDSLAVDEIIMEFE